MIATIDNIPVFNAVIADNECGMFRISLVDDPAVMSNFQTFKAERRPVMYAVQDEERRLVRGVVMRADFPIYRLDPAYGPYYIIYRADTIRTMAEKYLAEGRQNLVNIMHRDGSDVDGVQMVQYFIKGDGVSVNGFDDCADGSLLAEFHVTNDTVWNEIKAGTYRGFSLEGVFDLVPEQDAGRVQSIVDAVDGIFSRLFKNYRNMSKLSKFKAALARMLQEFGNVTTDKGVLAWDGDEEIKAGDRAYIEDADGNRTDAPDGDYTTDEGQVIVVAEGVVTEIRDAEQTPEGGDGGQQMAQTETDRGVLYHDSEEIAVGTEVYVIQDGAEEAEDAPDGEYIAGNSIIVVRDGVVTEIRPAESETEAEMSALRSENETLKAENTRLKAQVAKLKKQAGRKSAHDEFRNDIRARKTGDERLDNVSRILGAK